MRLHKIALNDIAQRVVQPFALEPIAQIDHMVAYLYLCHGAVARHRHINQDELFYVHSGILSLDTDWGRLNLMPHEFAVIPRGLGHISAAALRTVVMLFQTPGDADRKNGHGRTFTGKSAAGVPKWSASHDSQLLRGPYAPLPLAQVDEMSMRLVWCQGETSWHIHPDHDELILVEKGRLQISSEFGPILVEAGELLVISRNCIHRLTSNENTLALSLIHNAVTPAAQMGIE